jgi:hypothetical protein
MIKVGRLSRKKMCTRRREHLPVLRRPRSPFVFLHAARRVLGAGWYADVTSLCVKCAEGYLFGAQQDVILIVQQQKRCSWYNNNFFVFYTGMCSTYQRVNVSVFCIGARHKTFQHARILESVNHLLFSWNGDYCM